MTQLEFGLIAELVARGGVSPTSLLDDNRRSIDLLQGHIDSLWFDDHFSKGADPVFESWTTLSYLAALYPRLRFGNLVLCQSFRNAGMLAKMIMTLQQLSGGRYIAGIGAGWKEDEYQAYGYPFPPFKLRHEQLEDVIQILRQMWSHSPASFSGRHYAIQDAQGGWVLDTPPPLLIGGGGERYTLRLVAQYADWMNIAFPDPELFEHKLAVLQGHCQAVGRPFEAIKKSLWSYLEIKSSQDDQGVDARGRHFISGTPEKVAGEIRSFQALGVEHIMLRFVDFPNTAMATRFLREVLPIL